VTFYYHFPILEYYLTIKPISFICVTVTVIVVYHDHYYRHHHLISEPSSLILNANMHVLSQNKVKYKIFGYFSCFGVCDISSVFAESSRGFIAVFCFLNLPQNVPLGICKSTGRDFSSMATQKFFLFIYLSN